MIFKKHISVFLAFFLLVSNLGLAFNVHYCGDEISKITINTVTSFKEIEKDCCGKLEKKSNCCNTKLVKAQEKNDQLVLKAISFSPEFVIPMQWNPLVFSKKVTFHKNSICTYFCDANAPPLYLLYSQYTLYE